MFPFIYLGDMRLFSSAWMLPSASEYYICLTCASFILFFTFRFLTVCLAMSSSLQSFQSILQRFRQLFGYRSMVLQCQSLLHQLQQSFLSLMTSLATQLLEPSSTSSKSSTALNPVFVHHATPTSTYVGHHWPITCRLNIAYPAVQARGLTELESPRSKIELLRELLLACEFHVLVPLVSNEKGQY